MVQFRSAQPPLPLNENTGSAHINANKKEQILNLRDLNNAYPQAEIPVLQPRSCCVKKTVVIASQEESPRLGGHP